MRVKSMTKFFDYTATPYRTPDELRAAVELVTDYHGLPSAEFQKRHPGRGWAAARETTRLRRVCPEALMGRKVG